MVAMKWKIFATLFEIFVGISASTHWVVTENGRVQSQVWKEGRLRYTSLFVIFMVTVLL
jgi:hypothetical protein